MRKFIAKQFAKQGLELLKQAVLLVLYEYHVSGASLPSSFQSAIREHLGIQRSKSANDELIHGILVRLRDDKFATHIDDDAPISQVNKWQITKKGIEFIEN